MIKTMQDLKIRYLGHQDYLPIWHEMKTFTHQRTTLTIDELWLVEHSPVFTQGQAGKPEHILNPGTIPVIQTDRGGQVTYHGPGQLVMYTLLDISRLKIGIRELVTRLEQAVINTLSEHDIKANARRDAPGVYIDGAKICAVGLRIRRGCSYHGLAFNINMDIEPYSRINPCGYPDLKVTQLAHFVPNIKIKTIQTQLIRHFIEIFGYNTSVALVHWNHQHENSAEFNI